MLSQFSLISTNYQNMFDIISKREEEVLERGESEVSFSGVLFLFIYLCVYMCVCIYSGWVGGAGLDWFAGLC